MEKVERFIQEHTRNYSNDWYDDLSQGYESWLTPDNARKVAEIAREETIKEVCEWLKSNWMKYHWYDPYEDNEGYNGNGLINDLKKHLDNKL